MVFSSIPFLFYFFPIFFIIYYLAPFSVGNIRLKNGVLLVFSLCFYAWGEPVYIILMIIETLSDYICASILNRTTNELKRKLLLAYSLVVDISILFFFKYIDLFINSINQIFNLNIALLELGLPVGISFFTFQTLSYVCDVYKRRVDVEKNYLDYLTYVSMFPQLIAGPIVRFSDINKALKSREFSISSISAGFIRFLQGFLKKVLIANQIGALYDSIISLGVFEMSIMDSWLAAIAFTFQIYFDFSAYSDMAIGMGQMMGFNFNENFNYPLTAISITDFWRRWHISLSSWFRDYVYIPLGGNRNGIPKHIRNMAVVWLLTGFWHGASWNYVMWGVYYLILLLIEKYLLGVYIQKLPKIFQHIYSYVLVVIGFVIFSHEDIVDLSRTLAVMFLGAFRNDFINARFLTYLREYGVILVLCILLMSSLFKNIVNKIFEKCGKAIIVIEPVVYMMLFMLAVAYLVNDSYNPFLYFRF